jgi:hypothetical protein
MGYKKEEFSSFSPNKMGYPNAVGLISIDLVNGIHYDQSNGNVIVFNGNMAKVLTGTSMTYTTYNMTNPDDVKEMNSLPQIFTPTKIPYCYEIVKNKRYLIFIQGTKVMNSPFITFVDIDTSISDLTTSSSTPIKELVNYNNYESLITIDPINKIAFDTENGNIVHSSNNSIKIISTMNQSGISYNVNLPKDMTDMNDNIPKEFSSGSTFLYEIIPSSRYMLYIPMPNWAFINIIDTSKSTNVLSSNSNINPVTTSPSNVIQSNQSITAPAEIQSITAPAGIQSITSPTGIQSISAPAGIQSISAPAGIQSISAPAGIQSISAPAGIQSISAPA